MFSAVEMVQNALDAGASPRSPLGELTALPRPPFSWNKETRRRKEPIIGGTGKGRYIEGVKDGVRKRKMAPGEEMMAGKGKGACTKSVAAAAVNQRSELNRTRSITLQFFLRWPK